MARPRPDPTSSYILLSDVQVGKVSCTNQHKENMRFAAFSWQTNLCLAGLLNQGFSVEPEWKLSRALELSGSECEPGSWDLSEPHFPPL